jgi:hypothetical protein
MEKQDFRKQLLKTGLKLALLIDSIIHGPIVDICCKSAQFSLQQLKVQVFICFFASIQMAGQFRKFGILLRYKYHISPFLL